MWGRASAAVLAVALLVLAAPAARADTFTVETTADAPGECVAGLCPTLRAAVTAAGTTPLGDTIALGTGEYDLTLGPLALPAGTTVQGQGARATTIKAAQVADLAAGAATLTHLTASGALSSEGALTLDHVRATAGGVTSSGDLTLSHSLVDSSRAAGIASTGTLTASDSTVALNTGAGISGGGTLTHVTVAANGGAGLSGTGFTLTGSLIAHNGSDCDTTVTGLGGNVAGTFGCGFTRADDRVIADDADLQLATALADTGGETDVLRLAPGSKAEGYDAVCSGSDQRDVARGGGACEPGAYEIEALQLTGPPALGNQSTVTLTFSDPAGQTLHCALDGDAIEPCASPVVGDGLVDGLHVFTLQAINGDTPLTGLLSYSFTIDTDPPAPVFTPEPPPSLINTRTMAFAFSAQGATFRCTLDAGDPVGCASGIEYDDLLDGAHTFTLDARDAAGNVGERVVHFTVDTVAPDAPHVDAPVDGSLDTTGTLGFSGTTGEPGDFVTVSENGVLRLKVMSRGDGTWSAPVSAGDGRHSYDVTVADAAGNVSTATTVHVRVDLDAPAAPSIDAPADGSAQNTRTVALGGRAEADAEVEVLDGATSVGTTTAGDDGSWTLSVADVAEGTHTYTATATDEAARVSAPSRARGVRIDLTPPGVPSVSGGPSTFAFSTDDGEATFSCALDDAALAPCASPLAVPTPVQGDHRLTVRATDEAGNKADTAYAFTAPPDLFAAPPAPAATPTPAATPIATPAPTPQFGRTVVLRPAKGSVLIRRPGSKTSEGLHAKTTLPVGTIVDARSGVVVVTAQNAAGAKAESAQFSGGVFTVTQTSASTLLTLSGSTSCAHPRRLTGDGAGRFTIRGRDAGATGRGAKWSVQDACKGTIVRVTRGVVAVLDNGTRRTVLVRSGRHYEARPKR
jgi:hypothetical protein